MNNNSSNNSNKNSHQQQSQHHHHNNQYGSEHSLFVGELPDDCSDEKLQRLFQSKFKSVKRVQIIRHEDGKSRGFGFIRFEDRAEFQAALSQEMRIGARLLRLDAAHRTSFKMRNRYSSINSTGSNSSHQQNHHMYNNANNNSNNNNSSNNSSSSSLHHHHHHNPSHHHHHNQLHGQQHLPGPQQASQNSKTLMSDQGVGGQQHNQGGPHGSNGRLSNSFHHGGMNAIGPAPSTIHHHSSHTHQQQSQQLHNLPHNAQVNPNIFSSSQPKNSQQSAGNRSPKQQQQQQPNLGAGGDDLGSQNKPSPAQQSRTNILSHQQQPSPTQPSNQQNLSQVGNSSAGHAASNNASTTATSTSAVTPMSSNTDATSHPASALVSNQPPINTTGQAPIAPDYRGYAQSGMVENPHLIGATETASMVPQSNVYGHMYPYGPPPHFGYMPTPQPNPVIPISAVPSLPPTQVSSPSGVGQQHHPMPTGSAARYGNVPHPGQQHMSDAMNHMGAGIQAPPQAPFYYYYPSPFYFDQTGAAAPPNMYHPQTLHPQFFALPNPAYMPNAHTYANQHQTQPPTASQSDANLPIVSQQQPPQLQPQSHPQQVNIRTRDIDAPIE